MIRFERVERIGEGREKFYEENFYHPNQKPTTPNTKKFDFLENQFAGFLDRLLLE